MKDEKAFPAGTESELENRIIDGMDEKGMSKRFYAACKAMQGLLSTLNGVATKQMDEYIVGRAFEIADEMLKQDES